MRLQIYFQTCCTSQITELLAKMIQDQDKKEVPTLTPLSDPNLRVDKGYISEMCSDCGDRRLSDCPGCQIGECGFTDLFVDRLIILV